MPTILLNISCLVDKKKKIDKRKEINNLLRSIKELEDKSNADILIAALRDYSNKQREKK